MDEDITGLLQRWSGGDEEAMRELMPLIYPRLRAIAGGVLRGNREDSSFQPTVIVHEMYLRLVGAKSLSFSDREHFYSFAAQCMRFVLVDHFRKKSSGRRGGLAAHIPLHEDLPWINVESDDIVEMDRALNEFREIDARKVRLVELRYFLGCTTEEAADISGLSPATVKREVRVALAWLFERLKGGEATTPLEDKLNSSE